MRKLSVKAKKSAFFTQPQLEMDFRPDSDLRYMMVRGT
jgi:hypothetical protein